MNSFFAAIRKKENLALIFILLAASLLRFWHLNFQSVGQEEMRTLREADPSISLGETLTYLRCCDFNPPLYFVLQRIIFAIFGNTPEIARVLSAIAGVVGVWAIYLLGKEIRGRRLGLILATITTVNYFSIYYSQEARPYILVFLFTIFSLLYFIRLVKNLDRKNMWLYGLFTALMLNSHYFGVFVLFSQCAIAFIFMLAEQRQRKLFAMRFFVAALIIAAGYAFWMPVHLIVKKITPFWPSASNEDFYLGYFHSYFGDSAFLTPFLFILLSYFCIRAFMAQEAKLSEVRHSPLLLGFAIFLMGVVFSYLAPFMHLSLVLPMQFDRYTIVVLPFFLLAVGYGIELIGNRMLQWVILGIFVGLSLVNLFVSKEYYTRVQKTQFRELMDFVSKSNGLSYPLINNRIDWELHYFTDRRRGTPPIFTGKPGDVVDSILKKASPNYDVNGFWLIDACNPVAMENCIDSATRNRLLSKFAVVKEVKLHDAWAQLYLSLSEAGSSRLLGPTDFPPGVAVDAYNEKLIAVWGGAIQSLPFKLKKGNFMVSVEAFGTASGDAFPHLNVYVQDKLVGDFYTTGSFTTRDFPYTVPADLDSATIKIVLDNDYSDPAKGTDRNAFIRKILVARQ